MWKRFKETKGRQNNENNLPKSYPGFASLEIFPALITKDTKALVLHNYIQNSKILTEPFKMQFLKIHPFLVGTFLLLFKMKCMNSNQQHINLKKEIADNMETAHLVEFTCKSNRGVTVILKGWNLSSQQCYHINNKLHINKFNTFKIEIMGRHYKKENNFIKTYRLKFKNLFFIFIGITS